MDKIILQKQEHLFSHKFLIMNYYLMYTKWVLLLQDMLNLWVIVSLCMYKYIIIFSQLEASLKKLLCTRLSCMLVEFRLNTNLNHLPYWKLQDHRLLVKLPQKEINMTMTQHFLSFCGNFGLIFKKRDCLDTH